MRVKKLFPLIAASVSCFALSFAFMGKTEKAVAETAPSDTSLGTFAMYNGAQILSSGEYGAPETDINGMRFMATLTLKDYLAIEEKYGDKAVELGVAQEDTTEWGMLFTTKAKADKYELNEANVFAEGSRVYYWQKDQMATWYTDSICTSKPAQNATTMFTPVRYDNLKMSWYEDGRLINASRSLDGHTVNDYCVLSAYYEYDTEHEKFDPKSFGVELVARAYVTYVNESGERVYVFADYADGDAENNARSMSYLAQKYIERDSDKFEDKVLKYVVSMDVGFTVEYHFVDADGRSIVYPITVEPTGADWPHQTGETLQMTVSEIVDMSNNQELMDMAKQFESRVDWYNPNKVEVATAYSNNKTVFKLYYANADYANSIDSYDTLAQMSKEDKPGSVKSWYDNGQAGGKDDLSNYQFDKNYTLGDDVYYKTYCAEHKSADGCTHICDKANCTNPNHGHCSQLLTTKLYNNTLQINATLWDSSLNNGEGDWADMTFDQEGNVVSGLDFADYEYVLIRFYSSIGGMKMSLIAGSTTVDGESRVVTTGEWYEIKEGWNRIVISGEAIQKVIKDYYKTKAPLVDTVDEFGNVIVAAIYAPYRNNQYLQFLVDDSTYYRDNDPTSAEGAVDWTMYFEDIIGVKARKPVQKIDNGSFEDADTLNHIGTQNLEASLNTDAQYVFEGKQSLKLVDTREVPTNPEEDIKDVWTNLKLFLKIDGKPITYAELSQMEISFELYTTSDLMLWFAECVWTDAAPIKVNAWNTIRMSGWRMVDAMEKFVLPYGYASGYDATTGGMLLSFAGLEQGAIIYIENLQANYVTPEDQIVELDEFTQLPGRTEKLTAPVIEKDFWGSEMAGVPTYATDPRNIKSYPNWAEIPEHTANKGNPNYTYTYEVIMDNTQAITYVEDDVHHHRGYCISFDGVTLASGNAFSSFKVRAKEVATIDGQTVTRYSDWVYYEWTDHEEDYVIDEYDVWNGYVSGYTGALNGAKYFDVPNVTISDKGIASWDMVEGAFAYAVLINNEWKDINNNPSDGNEEPTINWLQKRQIALNEGDSISVRAVTQHRRDKDGNYLKVDGSIVTEKTVDEHGNPVIDTSLAQIILASAWSKPQVYNPSVSGKIIMQTVTIYDQEGNVIGTEEREGGETIYDVGSALGDVFWETSRIVSPVSGSDYAWKYVLGDKQNNGIFLLPLNIGGQPLTNKQLLAADYIELSIYAGENNYYVESGQNVFGSISFNGKIPPRDQCMLKPGQWNTVRVSTLEMYKQIQGYLEATSGGQNLELQNPYSNGYSPTSEKPLSRLCGYAVFEVANAKAGDYWIIDSARLVYDSDSPTHATNASYWFTQHDYDTMPITAYNALPPKTSDDYNFYESTIEDLETRLAKAREEGDEAKIKELEATLTNINNTVESLRKYSNIDYDALIQAYVDCGINTMMGLYDHANYSQEGHDFVVEMLKKCAENDLAYLIAIVGGTEVTSGLIASDQGKVMKEWLVEYASYGALAGIMLCDEPGAVLFDNIATSESALKEFLGDDYLYHANLLPNWSSKDSLLNFKNNTLEPWWDAEGYGYTYSYEEYVDEYIRMYQPEVLSFDIYPIVGRQNNTKVISGMESAHISDWSGGGTVTFALNGDRDYVKEGSQSLQVVTNSNSAWFNISFGKLAWTKEMLLACTSITFDIYSSYPNTVTLTLGNGDAEFPSYALLQPEWNKITIDPKATNASGKTLVDAIIGNDGFLLFSTWTPDKAHTLYIDNICANVYGEETYLRKGYYQNLATIRDASIRANIPFWTYIQTCSWYADGRLPTNAELRWNINTSLAYGAKGIQYFCGVVPYSSGGETFDGAIFDGAGVPTLMYHYVKLMNKQIQNIDHILMNSRSMGVIYSGELPQFYTVNSNLSYTALSAEQNALEKPTLGTLTSYGMIKEVYGNVLVGCFDYNGKEAYYVVNNSTQNYTGANLWFKDSENAYSGTIYGMGSNFDYDANGNLVVCNEGTTTAFLPNFITDNGAYTGVDEDVSNNVYLKNAEKGVRFTTDVWGRLLVQDMAPGEAFLVVMD